MAKEDKDRQKASAKLRKAMAGLKDTKLTPQQIRKFELIRACERESKYSKSMIIGPDMDGNYYPIDSDEDCLGALRLTPENHIERAYCRMRELLLIEHPMAHMVYDSRLAPA